MRKRRGLEITKAQVKTRGGSASDDAGPKSSGRRPSEVSLTANHRIKKKSDFEQAQTRGEKLYSKHFLVIVLKTERSTCRLGLAVTTKVNKAAAKRNKLKRRIREIFRLHRNFLRGSFDIVVIARKNATECEYPQIERELLGALQHHGYLQKDSLNRGKDV